MHPPRTPVLAGIGVASQREDDPREANEPLALMVAAALSAGRDAGAPQLLADIGYVAVPQGRWSYSNPAALIAATLGARGAHTTLAKVGILQQSLIGEACRRIVDGETDVALVVGAEAGYRLLRAARANIELTDTQDEGAPDTLLVPAQELRHPAELRAGLQMPIGVYALIDSAFRSARGLSLDEHMSNVAQRYSRFSEIAAANPAAWRRDVVTPEEILTPAPGNAMQAFPYPRLVCSSWSVDQGAALLFCSAERAMAERVPASKMLFPLVSTESNYMLHASARGNLGAVPGARLAATAAFEHVGLEPNAVDLIDLYSPFPIAVETYASEAGLPIDRDLTVTGGMAFAGGPYSTYVLQSTARLGELLRNRPAGGVGLTSAAAGVLTKQAFCVWSTEAGRDPFALIDVSADVERVTQVKEVVVDYEGDAMVVANTVLYDRTQPRRGVAVLDLPGGRRTVAVAADDAALLEALERGDLNGRHASVKDGRFAL
jgi:acetyl-CoA C-acetyltransferase